MKKTTTKSKKTTTSEYKAVINIMGKLYEAKGESISDAICNLKPQNCKGKGILTIEHGENKRERVIMPNVTFRLFNAQGLSKEIALKQISTLFQGI